jgi:hypothetical protein
MPYLTDGLLLPVNFTKVTLSTSIAFPYDDGALIMTELVLSFEIITGCAAVPWIFINAIPVLVPPLKQILSPGFTPFAAPSNCHSVADVEIVKLQPLWAITAIGNSSTAPNKPRILLLIVHLFIGTNV